MTSKDALELFLKHHGLWDNYQREYNGDRRIAWSIVRAGQTFFTRQASEFVFRDNQNNRRTYDLRWRKMWDELGLNRLRNV